jgi:hypothetical protein
MSQPRGCRLRAPIEPLRRTTPWGTQWGQLDGRGRRPLLHGGGAVTGRACFYLVKTAPTWLSLTSTLLREGRVAVAVWVSFGSPPGPACKIVTWLILPVVICLSQRLSHACLSISNHTVKLRMAH